MVELHTCRVVWAQYCDFARPARCVVGRHGGQGHAPVRRGRVPGHSSWWSGEQNYRSGGAVTELRLGGDKLL